MDLLIRPYEEVAGWLAARDPELDVGDPAGPTSHLLGVGLYAPDAEVAPRRPAEAFIVFVRGYHT